MKMLKALRNKAGLVILAMTLQALALSTVSAGFAFASDRDAARHALVEGAEPAAEDGAGEAAHAAESRGGKIAKWMEAKGIPPDLVVIVIAAMPIIELRGAIPVAHHVFDMGLVRSFVLSVIGNMLPVPAILLLLGPVSDVLRKISLFDKFFTWLFNRTRKRTGSIQKYQEIGLIIFIAIPLPATGAWTGALAAFLFGLRFWMSMVCVVAGVAIAGVIVSTFSAFGWAGAIAAGVVLCVVAAVTMLSRKKKASEASPAENG